MENKNGTKKLSADEIKDLQVQEPLRPLVELMNIRDIVALEEEATKQIEIIDKMKVLSLKVTARNVAKCWVNWGNDNYRLTDLGAERIRQLWGLSVGDLISDREDNEDAKGKYYIYTFMGVISKGNIKFEAVGTCSSRDNFFGTKNGAPKPLEDIKEDNIKKKAYTNFLVNSLNKFLGLQTVDAEMLKEAGIDPTKIPSVSFGGKGKGENPPTEKQLAMVDKVRKSHLLIYKNWKPELQQEIRKLYDAPVFTNYAKAPTFKNASALISFWIGDKEEGIIGKRKELEEKFKTFKAENFGKKATPVIKPEPEQKPEKEGVEEENDWGNCPKCGEYLVEGDREKLTKSWQVSLVCSNPDCDYTKVVEIF